MGIKLIKWELRMTAPTQCLMAVVYLAAGLLCLAPTHGITYENPLDILLLTTDEAIRLNVFNALFGLMSYVYPFTILILCARRFQRDLFANNLSPTRALPAGASIQLAVKACVSIFWLGIALSVVTLCPLLSETFDLVALDFFAGVSPILLLPEFVFLLSIFYYASVLRQAKFRTIHKFPFLCLCTGILIASYILILIFFTLLKIAGLSGTALLLTNILLLLAGAALYLVLTARQMVRRLQF